MDGHALSAVGRTNLRRFVRFCAAAFGWALATACLIMLAAGGLRSQVQLFEIWASEATGTWTVLLTRPDGTSCVMATGTHWFRTQSLASGVPG
ncbi:MAG: hypothetical protein QNJ44_22675 [Rhodobacter sp.]|nr:hypothetical protein [Rhodobacter sp.]